ncbi:MAG: DUF2179 domain-containing protein [Candidatus Hydrogenedens sp.]|jgi:uncharacterized protein YebE (UPF0316 family)|nr:DUF2179 domain-containing protein [Candidatus Hydrogenedens sp.]
MLDFFAELYGNHVTLLLTLLIFFARILDVSIGTMRIVFLNRGMRFLAPLCGFFENLIWLMAISHIMSNLTYWTNYVLYAGGVAAGNFVGMFIEERMAIGLMSVMIFSSKCTDTLEEKLKELRFGITRVGAQGAQGNVQMILIIIRRRDIKAVRNLLQKHQPDAFSVVNNVRDAMGGVFPLERTRWKNKGQLLRKTFL